uniref:procollagen-proline 3-dioxygenase n=1 Tax=Gadus morhua TaxID=8049 RepID=A0A8C5A2H0_GADMO
MDVNFSFGRALSLALLALLLTSSAAILKPYDLLYENAVRSFTEGDYTNAVRYMEGALSSYAEVTSAQVRCRLRCQDQHPFDAPFRELQFFEVVLHRSACINTCIEEKIGTQSMHKVSEDVIQDFNRRIPYNYLQLAYQKLKQPEDAAAAAHTYFQANPEHVEMGQNLEQYKNQEGMLEEHFVDREARPHQRSFSAGVRLYDDGDYEGAIVMFEKALVEYYRADVKCRALCQGPQRFEGHDHLLYRYSLHELISDHFTQTLHCDHECVRDLATRPGRLSPMENYLPLHYDYLQFAYFHGEKPEALQCAHTYLMFHQGEEFMTDNVKYYQEVLGTLGRPREVSAHCVCWAFQMCVNSEALILNNTNTSRQRSLHGFPQLTVNTRGLCPCAFICLGGPLVYDSVQLVQNSVALNGTQRVLLDDVISVEECSDLKQLAQAVTMAGDGYRGKMSPHTPNERFEGATVLKTLLYGFEGRVPLKSARLFYDVSERARRIIQSYFLLNSTLHFSYTHLVCRTAITGQQDHRNDLSHPIHADNCLLDPEANECWKEPPAYTYRDYSALLYLNGDFEGGEFIFTEMDAKTVTASVKPKCGRMVGFSSGGENPHGVKAVTRGQRCAVALWFTLDPLFRELERLQADEVVQDLDSKSAGHQGLNINPKDEL